MPAKGKVSLPVQTVFCIIPILDMYAAYRVKRLRKYLVIMILLVAIPTAIVDSIMFPISNPDVMEGFNEFLTFFYGVDNNHFVFSIATWAGSVLVAIYLVRRWSKQWNMQFDAEVRTID
jgi:formate hydrogenlyase subunit 3/multisubunit Na+/H+ antiporter MnhD subunit